MKTLALAITLLVPLNLHAFGISFGTGGDSNSLFGGSGSGDNVDTAWSLFKAGKSMIKGFEDLTPEQEYYLGRATSAHLLGRYKPIEKKQLHFYLNSLVSYLAHFSSRPETFSGYRVQVIDTKENSAYSAPGGFIMVSRNLLALCENEDELAAVLAHEIGHVSEKHGLSAIQTSHLTEAGKILGGAAMRRQGGADYAQATSLLKVSFGESVEDIVGQLVESGYSQSQESEADREAVMILARAGYNPQALSDFLAKAAKQQKSDDEADAFNKTHPGGDERIQDVQEQIQDYELKPVALSPQRNARFTRYLSSK